MLTAFNVVHPQFRWPNGWTSGLIDDISNSLALVTGSRCGALMVNRFAKLWAYLWSPARGSLQRGLRPCTHQALMVMCSINGRCGCSGPTVGYVLYLKHLTIVFFVGRLISVQ
jgi:hypothetical protein